MPESQPRSRTRMRAHTDPAWAVDRIIALEAEVERLQATVDRLVPYAASSCRTCGGRGSVPGFWYGTVKTCPACHGDGRQPA